MFYFVLCFYYIDIKAFLLVVFIYLLSFFLSFLLSFFLYLLIYSFINLFNYSFVCLFIHLLIYLFVYFFIYLFIYLFISLSIYSFIYLIMHSINMYLFLVLFNQFRLFVWMRDRLFTMGQNCLNFCWFWFVLCYGMLSCFFFECNFYCVYGILFQQFS